MLSRQAAVNFLLTQPYQLGHLLGFTKLTPLHNEWIKAMVTGRDDMTLRSHRGSYKTTCVSIALAIIAVLYRNDKTMFMRKTDGDTKEIVEQVKKLLLSEKMRYLCLCIYGVDLRITTGNSSEISTNLVTDPRGTAQIYAAGINGSLTGKHFDRIFTDDIVNVQDRISRAEREHTKLVYQELQNIRNRGGRIVNTGTPWHKEDAFTLMPNISDYDCYSTGLMSADEIQAVRDSMTASLFAANYELKHIADENVIFTNPTTGGDPAMIEQGISHIDAAYGGEDGTAFTICRKVQSGTGGEKRTIFYVYGRLWHKHIDDCEDEIINLHRQFNCGRIYCEDNGDKGYLAKELRRRHFATSVVNYHENTNKFIKITSFLKATWKDVVFVEGTDKEYIDQICDYNENAEHDDAPDSAASIIRILWKKKDNDYTPIYM